MSTPEQVVLELFVQGQSPHSNAACETVRRVCETYLPGRYRLEVIDIQQQAQRTRDARVMAAPALVRRYPEPVVRRVGKLSERQIMDALGLKGPSG